MEKKKMKLIGLDLDGTTLTTEKVLTERTKRAIEACLKAGIVVLPATGRAKKAIPEVLKKIDGIQYVLTSNGAAIMDIVSGETIYENAIPWKRALEIFDQLETYGTYYDVYADGCGWCEGRFLDHLEDYNISPHIRKMIKISRVKISNLRDKIQSEQWNVEKINMFFKSEEERMRIYNEIKEIQDLNVCYSTEHNLEINYHTCNKGHSLLELGKMLNIPREQIMACGDGYNDMEMIQMAGLGVAMENAEKEIKEEADFITNSNDQEGVAFALKKFVLESL